MATTKSIAHASGTLTGSANFANTETVVIGGKTYTFQDTLTNTDGNVKVGASLSASLQNLYDAINLSGTAGTQYAASTTAGYVTATSVTSTTLVVKAKAAGAVGNLITTTETGANASWGAAALAGGTGNVDEFITDIIRYNQINAEVLYELKKLTVAAD